MDKYVFIDNKYVLDRPLYKYFSNISYAISCIEKKCIHLDDPYELNDPFDDAFFNDGIGMDGKEGACYHGLLKWGKLSCFSEINDSILMWSYYADKHKGVCLEFDLNKLDQKELHNRMIKSSLVRVQYSPIRPHGDVFDLSNCNYMYTKADVWSHECEWRIICDTKEQFLPFDCISGLILGADFDSHNPKGSAFIEIAKKSGLTIKKCYLNREKYQLDIRP